MKHGEVQKKLARTPPCRHVERIILGYATLKRAERARFKLLRPAKIRKRSYDNATAGLGIAELRNGDP